MIQISGDRLNHILYGDATGGGHMTGYGDPSKSHFPPPPAWTAIIIRQAILAVANDPVSRRDRQPNGKMRVEGAYNGVIIRVVVDDHVNQVVTAHPINNYSIP